MTRRHEVGDGDFCPISESHGRMLTIKGTMQQQCPHQSHDGRWSASGKEPPTRSVWPLGHISFERAVRVMTLPEIDISELGG